MSDGYVSPWWQAVLLPVRWDVCGIELRTMSVWHTFALENLGNAYVCNGKVDRDAAASLLIICQRDWAGNRDLFLRPVHRARVLKKIHGVVKRLKWDDLDAAIFEYVQACNRTPEHKRKDGGKSASAPYQWHVVDYLASRNMTIEQAWNYPYALARCLFDTHREVRGDDSLADNHLQRSIDKQSGEQGEKR